MSKVYYIKPKVYRGEQGWHVGSRNNGGHWPISIFTPDRGSAERIRQAYRDYETDTITRDERDAITDRELLHV